MCRMGSSNKSQPTKTKRFIKKLNLIILANPLMPFCFEWVMTCLLIFTTHDNHKLNNENVKLEGGNNLHISEFEKRYFDVYT